MALITLVLLKVPYFFFIFQALWWNLIVLFDRLTCSLILLLSFSYKVLAQRPFLRACKIVRLCCFQKLSLAVPRTFGPWDGRSRTRSTVHGPSVFGYGRSRTRSTVHGPRPFFICSTAANEKSHSYSEWLFHYSITGNYFFLVFCLLVL